MQIPPTKSEYIAIYTPYIVIFIPRWEHTMAIFTTLRLTVVLSTILPHTTDRILQLFFVGLLASSYPFPRPCLSPRICAGWRRIFGRISSFWGIFGRIASAAPRSALGAVLLCCVSSSVPPPELKSFCGSAHFALNVSQASLPLQPHLANVSTSKLFTTEKSNTPH